MAKKSSSAKKSAKKTTAAKRTSKAETPAAVSAAEQREWRAKSDLNALREADEIRDDPQRMASAKKIFKQEQKALKRALS